MVGNNKITAEFCLVKFSQVRLILDLFVLRLLRLDGRTIIQIISFGSVVVPFLAKRRHMLESSQKYTSLYVNKDDS